MSNNARKTPKNAVGKCAKNPEDTPIIRVPMVERDTKRLKLPNHNGFWGGTGHEKNVFQRAGKDAAARHEEQIHAIGSRKRDGMHKASAQAKTAVFLQVKAAVSSWANETKITT